MEASWCEALSEFIRLDFLPSATFEILSKLVEKAFQKGMWESHLRVMFAITALSSSTK